MWRRYRRGCIARFYKASTKIGRDIKTIGKHINNALHEELASDPTGANFATIENSKNPTVAKTASIIVVIH